MRVNTLAISTSSPALSIALVDGMRVLAHHHELIGRGHAEALVPAVAELMAGVKPDRIIVDIGPGSYTGIRIGIAAARALGLAWGVPVTGISALSLVAAQGFSTEPVAELLAVIDAGRGQAVGAMIGRDRVVSMPAVIRTVPADVACAGAGVQLLPECARILHDSHPDAAFAGHVPLAALGRPAALYVTD